MSPRTTPYFTLILSALLPLSTLAIGDFPCSGSSNSQSCLLWSTDPGAQGTINGSAVCQPDPINPSVSYCGYAHAACTVPSDCDYGSCSSSGFCAGYLGDPCPNGPTDCQAFLFCGTDGTCGGAGAACANGDPASPIPSPNQQCVSNVCDTTAKVCKAPAVAGMPTGSGCGNPNVCASKFCSSGDLCQVKPVTPSQAATKKVKRYVLNGSGLYTHECPFGQTACAVGSHMSDGFECINSLTNLEQCGGCVTDGVGQDCTALPGVESVMCSSGRCVVISCELGQEITSAGTHCTPSQVW